MDNVVYLRPQMTSNEAKSIIIDNLKVKHQCKWVNPMCALRGLDEFAVAFDVLQELIGEGDVKVHSVPITNKHGSIIYAPLYRYGAISEFFDIKR